MQETPASEAVACCVKDIEDKNPQVMPLDKGQHIHRHRLPVLTQMNFSKNLLESPAYLRHSVMEHLIDKNMNRLVDRVMKETRYVRNKNTDEYKEIRMQPQTYSRTRETKIIFRLRLIISRT
jgi:hypothetical protein